MRFYLWVLLAFEVIVVLMICILFSACGPKIQPKVETIEFKDVGAEKPKCTWLQTKSEEHSDPEWKCFSKGEL